MLLYGHLGHRRFQAGNFIAPCSRKWLIFLRLQWGSARVASRRAASSPRPPRTLFFLRSQSQWPLPHDSFRISHFSSFLIPHLPSLIPPILHLSSLICDLPFHHLSSLISHLASLIAPIFDPPSCISHLSSAMSHSIILHLSCPILQLSSLPSPTSHL